MDHIARGRFALHAEFFRALAHPLRSAIFHTLLDQEKCVSDIARTVRTGQANVSRYLARTEWAGILSHPKEGLNVLYRLRSPLPVR